MDLDIDNMDFPLPDQAMSRPTGNIYNMTKEQVKEEIKDWMCIYPVYIDSKKTKAEGRKLGKEYCVESPTIYAMLEAMEKLQISTVAEDKKHPRDQLRSGRLKVNYLGNKKELLKRIAKLVPECQKAIDEREKAEEAAKAGTSGSSSSNKQTSSNNKKSNKKKGKKRR